MKSETQIKRVIIAGAGPAGLTAAYELAKTGEYCVTVFEELDMVGGISRTMNHNGNRIDIGGHRFFSKDESVMKWWECIMPLQTSPAKDELLLGATVTSGKHNPESNDRVMLHRKRVSRIFYLRRFFDYPVSLSLRTLRAMGLKRTFKAACGYLAAVIKKRPEDSLESFYINRFGRPLYRMFFEDYTEKVWGVHPSQLGADWGSQRVKGLSVFAILKDMMAKCFRSRRDASKVETSLIEEFLYPKYGPGQMWETVAAEATNMGAKIQLQTPVKKIHLTNGKITSVTVRDKEKGEHEMACDIFLSSMPVKHLIAAMDGIEIPAEVKRIASGLPYRSFITVGLLVDKLAIKNETAIRTYDSRVPDTWIYVQERNVKLGRIQIFNNWSPYMVKDFENTVWLGLEYFCNEGDEMWELPDDDFIKMAIRELEFIGIIKPEDVKDSVRIKIPKAYPAYFGSYNEFDKVREFLDTIPNLYCIGRNGQHRYNNMDHSMLTAMEAVRDIESGCTDKSALWSVNSEKDYHEAK